MKRACKFMAKWDPERSMLRDYFRPAPEGRPIAWQACEMHEQGMTFQNIAKALGFNRTDTVAKLLVMARSREGSLVYRFLAFFRIDLELVCALSRDKGLVDFHDYKDTEHGQPWAMGTDKCARCGKEFSI